MQNSPSGEAVADKGLELISEGILHEMPPLRDGAVLMCRYNPGYGRRDCDIICSGPIHFQQLIEGYMRGQMLQVRWYHAPAGYMAAKAH